MHEFAVWAPKPDTVRLDVDGTAHPMTRGRRRLVAGHRRGRPGRALRISARRRPEAAARSAITAPARRGARPLAAVGAHAAGLDGRRLARSFGAGCGDLRAAHRHVHAGGHLRRGDRQAGLSGRPRRRLRRSDAGERVFRNARLGLRRRAVVRGARTLRRTRRAGPIRRRLPSPRPGSADRRGVQSPRPVGQLPAPVRALPVVGQ